MRDQGRALRHKFHEFAWDVFGWMVQPEGLLNEGHFSLSLDDQTAKHLAFTLVPRGKSGWHIGPPLASAAGAASMHAARGSRGLTPSRSARPYGRSHVQAQCENLRQISALDRPEQQTLGRHARPFETPAQGRRRRHCLVGEPRCRHWHGRSRRGSRRPTDGGERTATISDKNLLMCRDRKAYCRPGTSRTPHLPVPTVAVGHVDQPALLAVRADGPHLHHQADASTALNLDHRYGDRASAGTT